MSLPPSPGKEPAGQSAGMRLLQVFSNREPTEADADRAEADMRIVKAIHQALTPLTEEGYLMTETSLEKSYDGTTRQVTLLHRDDEQYYLASLPREILRSSSRVSERLVAFLDLLFPKDSLVFFVSHHCDAVQLGLHRRMGFYKNSTASFIPWFWIRPDSEGRPQPVEHLLDAFNLEPRSRPNQLTLDLTGGQPNGAAAIGGLSEDQIALTAGNLDAHMAANDGHIFFNDLIQRLALTQRQARGARACWGDSGALASTRLIRWAHYQGAPILGRLLRLLIEEGPGRPEAPELLEILVAHGQPPEKVVVLLRAELEAIHG
jgi:hypothetical protein